MKSGPLTPTLSPGCARGEGAKSSPAGGIGAKNSPAKGIGAESARSETPSPLAQPGERAGVRGWLSPGNV